MMPKTFSFKSSLSFNNRTIAYYHGQINQQKQLLKRIRAVLPEALAQQATHCLVKDKKLLIYTNSANWASQLRFYNPLLLASIAPFTSEPINGVKIRLITTLTDTSSSQVSPVKVSIPTAETIDIIRNQSLSIQDQSLKMALLSLSATLKRLSDNA